MSTRFNEPNYSFVIETKTKGGEHLNYWRIDQVVAGQSHNEALRRVENQLAQHLNHLSKRTGLVLFLTFAGTVETIDTIVKNSGYEIS